MTYEGKVTGDTTWRMENEEEELTTK